MKRTVFSPSRLFKGSLALLLTLAFILPSLLVFPLALGDTENSEGSLEHTKLYNVVNSSNKKYYQHSDIRMSYDTNYASYLRTFLLMNTTSTANASPKSGWSAEKAKDANYMVAYCADWRTGSITNSFDSGKATYDTLTLDNSRISNSPNAAAIEGIINHAYPFITKAQMDAQLESAGLTKGSEADYIAAAQLAIWTLFTMDFPSYSFKYYGFSSIDQSDDLNPLSKRSSGMSNTNLKKIVNWLVKQRAPEDLAVSSYTNTEDGILTPNGDGTYTATVTVTLNRALRDGESVSASLVVGRRSGERVTVGKNANTLTLTLSDLEYDEVRQNGLFVDLTASGKKISVYFFDSDYYQDMVSGKAENYTRNLSFSVT
ncbi:MAG: thioester domain-containing protein, partial [Clostridia bacterium]|nr:thioester domain-containing protein [Clostridia bacterium]